MFKSKLLLLLILPVFLMFFSPSYIFGQSILLEDNFDDNFIGNQWNVKNYSLEELGSYSPYSQLDLVENQYELRISGYDILPDTFIEERWVGWFGRSLISYYEFDLGNLTEISTKVKILEANKGFQVHLTAEFSSNNRIVFSIGDHSYGSQNGPQASQLVFEENNKLRCVSESLEDENDSDCVSIPINLIKDEVYILKIEIDKNTGIIKGYLNDNLVHIGTFKGNFSKFHTGLAATVRDTENYIDAGFDDFKVYSNSFSNTLNVPDIKQFALPWGPQEYDYASIWSPSNPSISRWGCALASATMVLNYYGHDLNPEQLNNWLKSQPDGYTRNGGVMWPAISRYTRINSSSTKPTLEFAYHPPSNDFIASEIDAQRPPILKMQKPNTSNTHFLVAKGKQGNDFLINDPASSTNSLLSHSTSQWGHNVRIGRFLPSHTDLSYIVLMVNNNMDLKVYDPLGNLITEGYTTEDPIVAADDTTQVSGETLKAFYLPKPESGQYRVGISGLGEYTLDSYLYDAEGNVYTSNNFGQISEGKENKFLLAFDKVEAGNSYFEEVTFDTLMTDLDNAYLNSKLKNYGFYNSIKVILTQAKRKYEDERIDQARKLLGVVIKKLKVLTPNFIDENTSELLQIKITFLLENLEY